MIIIYNICSRDCLICKFLIHVIFIYGLNELFFVQCFCLTLLCMLIHVLYSTAALGISNSLLTWFSLVHALYLMYK